MLNCILFISSCIYLITAALIAYEKAMRCHLECNSLVFLKMRCEALLKCINALNLVVPEYAWIAKPSIFKESKSQEESVSKSDLKESSNVSTIFRFF